MCVARPASFLSACLLPSFRSSAGLRPERPNQTVRPRHPDPLRKARTVDEYLARLNNEKLRKTIRTAAPRAEECISHGLPAFRLNGKFLLALGATARHCAFYLGSTVQEFKSDLRNYDTSKGTIRFQADDPIPAALVRKLIKARIASRSGTKRRAKSLLAPK